VLQIRAYLRDIFAEAVDQDFLVKDPARKVTVPTQLRDTDRTTLTWPQLRRALSKLELRDRILPELDMTNALRPSELFALRWQCFDHAECTMRLVERVTGKFHWYGLQSFLYTKFGYEYAKLRCGLCRVKPKSAGCIYASWPPASRTRPSCLS
jgi:integrase